MRFPITIFGGEPTHHHREQHHQASRHHSLCERTPVGGHRIEECCGRNGYHPIGIQPTADLQATNPVLVCVQRPNGGVGWLGSALWFIDISQTFFRTMEVYRRSSFGRRDGPADDGTCQGYAQQGGVSRPDSTFHLVSLPTGTNLQDCPSIPPIFCGEQSVGNHQTSHFGNR